MRISGRLFALAALLALTSLTSLATADDRVGTSPIVDGLELSIAVEPRDLSATLTLRNTGKQPRKVLSHVQTHELHYDWFEIELTWPKAERGTCSGTGKLVLKLMDSREKSYPVTKELPPGGSLSHKVSIPDWAARAMNKGVRLGGSYYKIVARYRVKGETGVWNGELVTTPARVLGLDQMRKDVCPTNPGWDRF
ncbi:MAG TPA: hypothetical protein VN253_04940 [Kofleriaceae bacterium]|nr:hypothetical protein [Kofleriaceae bacterium]